MEFLYCLQIIADHLEREQQVDIDSRQIILRVSDHFSLPFSFAMQRLPWSFFVILLLLIQTLSSTMFGMNPNGLLGTLDSADLLGELIDASNLTDSQRKLARKELQIGSQLHNEGDQHSVELTMNDASTNKNAINKHINRAIVVIAKSDGLSMRMSSSSFCGLVLIFLRSIY